MFAELMAWRFTSALDATHITLAIPQYQRFDRRPPVRKADLVPSLFGLYRWTFGSLASVTLDEPGLGFPGVRSFSIDPSALRREPRNEVRVG